jgi:hypothetical protein
MRLAPGNDLRPVTPARVLPGSTRRINLPTAQHLGHEAVTHPVDGLSALEEARPTLVTAEPDPHPLAVEFPLTQREAVGERLGDHLLVGHDAMVARGCGGIGDRTKTLLDGSLEGAFRARELLQSTTEPRALRRCWPVAGRGHPS